MAWDSSETATRNGTVTRLETAVSADYIRTGRCPHLIDPLDERDNFHLETVLLDLCFRGYIPPGFWVIHIE